MPPPPAMLPSVRAAAAGGQGGGAAAALAAAAELRPNLEVRREGGAKGHALANCLRLYQLYLPVLSPHVATQPRLPALHPLARTHVLVHAASHLCIE